MSSDLESKLSLFSGYSDSVKEVVINLIESGKLNSYINKKYPEKHQISSNKALVDYVQEIKKYYMKKSPPIHKIVWDDTVDRVYNALGLNSSISRSHGKKMKSTNEIRISSLFKKAPEDFLRMIVVHELAHIKEKNHDKKFYSLCKNMESDYFQLEFDLRLYLISLEE